MWRRKLDDTKVEADVFYNRNLFKFIERHKNDNEVRKRSKMEADGKAEVINLRITGKNEGFWSKKPGDLPLY